MLDMGRQKRYRQKRHEQVHSLKSKSLKGLLVREFIEKQNLTQKEAEVVANYCFRYLDSLIDSTAGQITYEIIDGKDNHSRYAGSDDRVTKEAILTIYDYSDIELLEEFGMKAMQNNRILRIIEQAYHQDGILDYNRICLLTPMTKKTLRKRMKKLWNKEIRCPLSGMNKEYRLNMSEFRQTRALKRYLCGENLEEIRQDLFLSRSQWEDIYSTFNNIIQNKDKSVPELADMFNISQQQVCEYLKIPADYDIDRVLEQSQSNRTPGDVSSREKFISGLEDYCGFFPALADRVERDLRELSEEVSISKRDQNEIIYYAISDHEPAGRPLSECELTPISLEYVIPEDQQIFNLEGLKELKWKRAERYATNAKYQGGLLNQIDLAFLIGISPAVLQRLSKEHDNIILPTRGNMIDMGPAVSHAETIIGYIMDGYEETQIEQKTHHSLKSIERYKDNFIKVVGLLEIEGLSPPEIRKVLDCSKRLVNKYIELYHQYNTGEYQWFMEKEIRNVYRARKKYRKKK